MGMIIFFSSVVAVFLCCAKGGHPRSSCIRGAFLSTAVIIGTVIVFSTETLSYFQQLTVASLIGLWAVMTILPAIFFFLLPARPVISADIKTGLPKWFEAVALFFIIFILIIVGLIALIAPPNNWDSLTYHMGRVMHWIQNKGVAHYPTAIPRQLFYSPGAEFILTHFQLLSGSDRFANLAQWLSMLGCVLGVSLIAKFLKASAAMQIAAALICVTIPMGILQGSSTQNDYVVAFWLVCLVHAIFLWDERKNLFSVFSVGASLGLAVLTKGTGLIYSLPLLGWLILLGVRKAPKRLLKDIGVIFFVSFVINIGHYSRNIQVYGNFLGDKQHLSELRTTGFQPPLVFSVLIRNIGLHCGTAIPQVNQMIEKQIINIHKALRVDVTDPRVTFGGHSFSVPVNLHEDTAGNFTHLVLFIVALALFISSKELRAQTDCRSYLTAILVAFLLFSGLLKWQPFNSRLLLPLFVLAAPFIVRVLSRLKPQKIVMIALIACLIPQAMPYVFRNASRRVISKKGTIFSMPRLDQYFQNDSERMAPYQSAAATVARAGCHDIGLMIGKDDWEYPLWVLLRSKTAQPIRIEHVKLNDQRNFNYPLGRFHPCAIVGIHKDQSAMAYDDYAFTREWEQDPVVVFFKRP